jgi:predicted DNA-binding protein (UPF0251 family)
VIMNKKHISPLDPRTYKEKAIMYRRRRRRGKKGRPPKPVWIGVTPPAKVFRPSGPPTDAEPVYLEPAELEALRLVDQEGLSQEEAGEKMGISRGTIWRLLQTARKKVAQALAEGRPIQIR